MKFCPLCNSEVEIPYVYMLIKVDICKFYQKYKMVYFIVRVIKIWPFVKGTHVQIMINSINTQSCFFCDRL